MGLIQRQTHPRPPLRVSPHLGKDTHSIQSSRSSRYNSVLCGRKFTLIKSPTFTFPSLPGVLCHVGREGRSGGGRSRPQLAAAGDTGQHGEGGQESDREECTRERKEKGEERRTGRNGKERERIEMRQGRNGSERERTGERQKGMEKKEK